MQKLAIIAALLAATFATPVRAQDVQDACVAAYRSALKTVDLAKQTLAERDASDRSLADVDWAIFAASEWVRLSPSSRALLCADARLSRLLSLSVELRAAGLLPTEAERAETAQQAAVRKLDKAVRQASDSLARRKAQSPP